MENIGASVSAVLTPEKKEVEKKIEEEEEIEEEECIPMENEVVFFLKEAPEYRISAVAEWGENYQGDITKEVDTYFLHILTNQRCETVRDCFTGWSEQDENSTEMWKTLCLRIEEYENIEQDMCYEKTLGV